MSIELNLKSVKEQIYQAEEVAGRPKGEVKLLAVSKKQSVRAIQAAIAAGQHDFGENYVQEGVEKINAIADNSVTWHFIGPIQSNKTKAIARHFAWVHSVSRLKIATYLNEQRPETMPPLNVCLQVNISGESTKSGVTPDALFTLAEQISQLPRLRLRGLMAIPQKTGDAVEQLATYQRVQRLFEQLQQEGVELDTLSMGMSGDFVAAIAAGATWVRIGCAIFGARE